MRRCQHTVCQCRRDAAPACVGHTTTCARPGYSSWSQPGQRYALVGRGPGNRAYHPVAVRPVLDPLGAKGRGRRGGPGFPGLARAHGDQAYPGGVPVLICGGALLFGGEKSHRWYNARAAPASPQYSACVRLVIARCSVDYDGRLTAHLPSALRLLIVKADGSVLVHSDGGSYKPLNWMSPPCRLTEHPGGTGSRASGR